MSKKVDLVDYLLNNKFILDNRGDTIVNNAKYDVYIKGDKILNAIANINNDYSIDFSALIYIIHADYQDIWYLSKVG